MNILCVAHFNLHPLYFAPVHVNLVYFPIIVLPSLASHVFPHFYLHFSCLLPQKVKQEITIKPEPQ